MAWLGVDSPLKGLESVIGMRVSFFLESVAPELREECAFGNEARCFEWAAVRD
jgi:hypothetical protein